MLRLALVLAAFVLLAPLVSSQEVGGDGAGSGTETGAEAEPETEAEPEAGTEAGSAKDTAPRPLSPGELARVGDVVITEDEYLRYVGTVCARRPEGELAFRQILTARVVHAAAEEVRVSATDADVDDLIGRLDARARAATGGAQGLFDSVDADPAEVRDSLRLLALQEKVVAAETGIEHPGDELLQSWLEARLGDVDALASPLDDAVAARWPGGEVSRLELGRAVADLLPDDERSGILTELLGIVLIRAHAAAQGVALTPEALAGELELREALVHRSDATAGVSYAEIVRQTEGLSLEELVATPSFGAQVLLRLLVEARWTEDELRALFEAERADYEERYGAGVSFEAALPGVWATVRRRTYRQLFADATIVRRF